MTNYESVINDLKDLRGKEVYVFGQKTVLDKDCSKFVVDAIELVEYLKEKGYIMELEDIKEELYNLGFGEEFVEEVEEQDDFINLLIGEGIINNNNTKRDNTYNSNGNISNNMYIHIYKNEDTEEVYVTIAFHRYGDVRCNYTDELLLKFDNEYYCLEFFEGYDYDNPCCATNIVMVDGKEYEITSRIFTEEISVVDIDNGEEVCELYGYYDNEEEVIEEIRNKLNELND